MAPSTKLRLPTTPARPSLRCDQDVILPTREPARAKVNLNLAIVGRDAAGYHLLETLMAFADGAEDMLTLDVGEADDALEVLGPFAPGVPAGGDNLVLRATRLVRKMVPSLPPLRWTLDKQLPVAAGIGGGSADAGAALRLLGRALDVQTPILSEAARELGADVPAAFHDGAVWATGRGETLTPVVLPPLPAVLVNPNVICQTPSVFQAYREGGIPFSQGGHAPHSWATAEDVRAWCVGAGNDLLKPARTAVPAIAGVLTAIARTEDCRFAGMSGSGATCFGLFDSKENADRAADRLATERPAWWARAVTIT